MKILLLSSDYLPNIGGIAAHVHGLAQGLTEAGHEVVVLVPSPVRPWSSALSEEGKVAGGYCVIRQGFRTLPRFGMNSYHRRLGRFMVALHDRFPYDVLHWHTFESDSVRWVRGHLSPRVPLVFTNHTSYFLEYITNSAQMPVARNIVEPADYILAPSQELVDASVTAGYGRSKTSFIANGVNLRKFAAITPSPAAKVRILCPRRLEKKNGVIYFVRALRLLLDRVKVPIEGIIAGDYHREDEFSSKTEVFAEIEKLNLKESIRLLGMVPPEKMPAVYADADIVVLPSLLEATSIAGLEAMSSGLPMVGTNVGGIPAIIENGRTGLLVPPRDPEAIAQALERFVTNETLRRQFGQAAREKVEREFSWAAIARATADVYEMLRTPI